MGLRLLISSGEPSSDVHAAAYLRAILRIAPDARAFGIGGPALAAIPEFETTIGQERLTAMGFAEVLGKLPDLRRVLGELKDRASRGHVDVAILFDYPDFHFRLAKRLGALGIPVICFIPPKIWAWRSGRIDRIRELYRHVFTILPFETPIYRSAGVPMDYVGNPLLDELPLNEGRARARVHFDLNEGERALLLMPGSRAAEVRYLLPPFLETARRLLQARPATERWKILLPLPNEKRAAEVRASIRELGYGGLPIAVSVGDSGHALAAAEAGLIKSGTSSLEGALLGCPHVVTYHGHWMTKVFFKFVVRYGGAISLTNLIDDFKAKKADFVVPELILEDFSIENFVARLTPLLSETPELARMRAGFRRVREKLAAPVGDSPMAFAAARTIALASAWAVERNAKSTTEPIR